MMDRDSFTVAEFCERHGICRSTFYNLVKAGEAPRQMRVGTRVLISKEAAADWRRAREAAAASPEEQAPRRVGAVLIEEAVAAAENPTDEQRRFLDERIESARRNREEQAALRRAQTERWLAEAALHADRIAVFTAGEANLYVVGVGRAARDLTHGEMAAIRDEVIEALEDGREDYRLSEDSCGEPAPELDDHEIAKALFNGLALRGVIHVLDADDVHIDVERKGNR